MSNDHSISAIKSDLLKDSCDYEHFEHNERELKVREMRTKEYGDWLEVDGTDPEDWLEFMIRFVQTADGRQVFDWDEDGEVLLELPRHGSVVDKIQDAFLVVNDMKADLDTVDRETVMTILMASDDEEEVVEQLRQLVTPEDDEDGGEGNSENSNDD